MKTFGKFNFGVQAVQAGQKSSTVNAEPQLIANSTPGKFVVTAPVSKALNIAVGENIMFLNNIAAVEAAVQSRNADVVAYAEELGIDLSTREGEDALVAALSDKVFVLECGIKSGTMHTVKHALKMRKPIAVLDGVDLIGDFSGNEEIMNKSLGVKISNEDDLDRFISYTEYKAKDNQLSFI